MCCPHSTWQDRNSFILLLWHSFDGISTNFFGIPPTHQEFMNQQLSRSAETFDFMDQTIRASLAFSLWDSHCWTSESQPVIHSNKYILKGYQFPYLESHDYDKGNNLSTYGKVYYKQIAQRILNVCYQKLEMLGIAAHIYKFQYLAGQSRRVMSSRSVRGT